MVNVKDYTHIEKLKIFFETGSTIIVESLKVNYIRLKNNIIIVSPGRTKDINSSDYVIELKDDVTLFDFASGANEKTTIIEIDDPLVDRITFNMKKTKDENDQSYLDTEMLIHYPNPNALSEFGLVEVSYALNFDDDKYSLNLILFNPDSYKKY